MRSLQNSKLIKKSGSGEDGSEDKHFDVAVMITDTAGSPGFAESMIKAERTEERTVRVKGRRQRKR